MLTVGILDNDGKLVESLEEVLSVEFKLRTLDEEFLAFEGVDVVVVDPMHLNGRITRFVRDLRSSSPRTALIFTYVYCDATQHLEGGVLDLADVCVVKPYDFIKLGQTIRWAAAQREQGAR